MTRHPTAAVRALVAALGRTRTARAARRHPDRGSYSVEYAIGIGLAAAAILTVFAAYKIGLADIVQNWVFS